MRVTKLKLFQLVQCVMNQLTIKTRFPDRKYLPKYLDNALCMSDLFLPFRLAGCKITEASLQSEASVVIQTPLRELDLSRNPLNDSGVKKLLGLKSLHHSLRDLR